MPAKMFNQFICSSLMLPEHRDALNSHNAALRERETKMRRPCIAEERYQLWDQLLCASLHQGKAIMVTIVENEEACMHKGVVRRIEPSRREICMNVDGSVKRITFDSILEVE